MDSRPQCGIYHRNPWLKVNENRSFVNAETQEKDPNSILNYFRKLVKLRKEKSDLLVYGKYTLLDRNNSKVYAYTRESGNDKLLVLLCFSKEGGTFDLGDLKAGEELINNMTPLKIDGKTIRLQPYQACVLKLK